MGYSHTVGGITYSFSSLKELLAKATPARSGDYLAGSPPATTRSASRRKWRSPTCRSPCSSPRPLIPYESDEVTRLIIDSTMRGAFARRALTVGEASAIGCLSRRGDESALTALAPGLTPEMAAAVSKIMRVQDLILVAAANAASSPVPQHHRPAGRLSTRLQPNHPTDDPRGIAASVLDGLLYGSGDAVIGINPATDSLAHVEKPAATCWTTSSAAMKSRPSPACWPTSPPPWS